MHGGKKFGVAVLAFGVTEAAAGVAVAPGAADAATTPIVIGGQGDLAGAPGVVEGFEARISSFNKAGGVGGRTIKFIGVMDDNFTPSTNLANAQKLVLNDHVLADAPFIG